MFTFRKPKIRHFYDLGPKQNYRESIKALRVLSRMPTWGLFPSKTGYPRVVPKPFENIKHDPTQKVLRAGMLVYEFRIFHRIVKGPVLVPGACLPSARHILGYPSMKKNFNKRRICVLIMSLF